jgi:hypothetical protein
MNLIFSHDDAQPVSSVKEHSEIKKKNSEDRTKKKPADVDCKKPPKKKTRNNNLSLQTEAAKTLQQKKKKNNNLSWLNAACCCLYFSLMNLQASSIESLFFALPTSSLDLLLGEGEPDPAPAVGPKFMYMLVVMAQEVSVPQVSWMILCTFGVLFLVNLLAFSVFG